MAHKKIVYVQSPFVLKWYRLDLADVLSVCSYIRDNFNTFPESVRQSMVNLYNDLQKPKNPRNLKLV